jgi:polyhydroxyalkanoate synthase subunit PhaC
MPQLASGPARTRPAKRSSGRKPAAPKAAADTRPEPGPSEPGKDESPAGRAPQGESEAAEAVMGLDMVLVDAARGPLRRLVPPAGTALRFGSALARKPSTVASRASELAREVAKIAAGNCGSPTPPGRATGCCAGPCSCTWPPPGRRGS